MDQHVALRVQPLADAEPPLPELPSGGSGSSGSGGAGGAVGSALGRLGRRLPTQVRRAEVGVVFDGSKFDRF